MSKKLLALLLALLMVVGMVACAAKEEAPAVEEETPVASDDQEATPAEDEAPAEEAALSGTINYVSWMTKGEDLGLLEGFMAENPDVEVVNRSLDGSSYIESLTPMMLNGDTPDVFMVEPYALKDLAKEGFIRPIDDMPGVAEQNEKNPGLVDIVSYNGQTYGYIISGQVGYGHVYYNVKYFEKHGLEVPTTLEEFEELCAKIKELGDDPMIISAGDTWSAFYFGVNQWYKQLANLGETENYGAQKALLTGEAKVSDLYGDAFRQMAQYYENGWVSQAGLSMGWESACQLFVDGGAPMFASGAWVPTSAPIADNTNEDFELGAFPIPGAVADDGNCYESAGVSIIMVMSADSENVAAQEALFNYIKREDVLVPYLNENGYMGLNVTNDTDPVLDASYASLKENYITGTYGSLSYMPTGWNANVAQYNADIFSGVDVEELLAKLDSDFAAVLENTDVDAILESMN